ncbi:uncharacterized protein HGUI_03882 [Hanseniaspora guilliermondii]|uniref:Dol-P-Glc:Glc(2)Man(9)GlcNAc(2)-PP-Dol alpha-1,2-glucosyltransferase n=1 Tax=Hanseniaspora guilliermondii TaxID=56406 RepID=A0A1L0CSX8_9ASCO|nr:uncharacterized protein HGUI_03882 [Hanseniaspora guilliermondii]
MSSVKNNDTDVENEKSIISVYWKAITDKNARISENESYLTVLVTLNIVLLICLVIPYLVLKIYMVHRSDLKTAFTYDNLYTGGWSSDIGNEYKFSMGLYYTKKVFDCLIKTPLRWINYTKFEFSNVAQLRLLNFFAAVVLLPFMTYSSLYALTAICFMVPTMVIFPLISPYYNVYHSIVWSTFWILSGLLYASYFNVDENEKETDCKKILKSKKLNIYISGICCFLSLFFNKSNIFWVTLIAFIGIERQTIMEHDMNNIWFNNYLKLLLTALQNFNTLILPYSFSFILYAYLSIKSENGYGSPLHLVQIFYCLSYITFFSLPLWLNQEFIITYLIRTYGNIDRVLITLLYNILIAAVIRFTSYDSTDSGLAKDTMTGFIFKKLLYRNFFSRYFIALPIYNFSWYTVQELLSNSLLHFPDCLHPLKVHKVSDLPLIMTHMSRTLFWVCISATLISTKLVDSKLYIIPYLVWRVYICPDQNKNIINLLLKEFAWFCLIDVVFFVYFPDIPLA